MTNLVPSSDCWTLSQERMKDVALVLCITKTGKTWSLLFAVAEYQGLWAQIVLTIQNLNTKLRYIKVNAKLVKWDVSYYDK